VPAAFAGPAGHAILRSAEMNRSGGVKARESLREAKWDDLRLRYEAGIESIEALAREVGMPVTTLRYRALRAGWQRPQWRQDAAERREAMARARTHRVLPAEGRPTDAEQAAPATGDGGPAMVERLLRACAASIAAMERHALETGVADAQILAKLTHTLDKLLALHSTHAPPKTEATAADFDAQCRALTQKLFALRAGGA
jgi:hypothetical protein